MLTRRESLVLGSATAWLALLPSPLFASYRTRLPAAIAAAEARVGGRLGVAVLDTATGKLDGHRADERFPLCSTFKLLAVACVLGRIDKGAESLTREVPIPFGGLIEHSPVTGAHAGGVMKVASLCEAAMTISDNTAANLLLATIDGPSGLTAWLRALGDPVTRLDRMEPDLNEAVPGDLRDTTSPAAMIGTMQRLLLGDALSLASRERLTGWLIANKTGGKRLRAGLPSSWQVGDKTGSGQRGASNDVAIIWPPKQRPLLVAAYLADTRAAPADRDATLAAVGRLVAG
ncbi:class A beta-lactamase [Emcibacter sp. SYSU 3D8]|uniref:class A beta-lactamase n=1 Tax=Emcibacter sp. SYSU 3D8 TaxID=3133969 RepID=UPI0031FF1CBB